MVITPGHPVPTPRMSPLMAKVLNRKLLRTPDDFDGACDNCF